MPSYAAGAIVERRYPGPDQDASRAAAEAQVQAFLGAGWQIVEERWEADAEDGAPIGDAIASGPVSYLAGTGGQLVVTFRAAADADLPLALPEYTLTNPRAETLRTAATMRLVFLAIVGILALLFFANFAGQMGRMQPGFGDSELIYGAPASAVESPS